MRYGISLVALLFVLSAGAAPLFAQGRGNGHANKPTARTTQGTGKTSGPKADRPKPATGKKTTTPTAANTETTQKGNPHKGPKAKEVAVVTPTALVTPTTPTTQHVKNPKLEARLLALLPPQPPGTTIHDLSAGFKNWGQFVAAVHVSNNLGIPFADLKARMTGLVPGTVPGTFVQATPMSLGQAIQSFKGVAPLETPEAGTLTETKIKNEVKKAEDAANVDLRRTRDSN